MVLHKKGRVEGKNQEEFNMAVISMKQLLEAGVHFGHQTRRSVSYTHLDVYKRQVLLLVKITIPGFAPEGFFT